MCIKRRNREVIAIFHVVEADPGHHECVVADDLRRSKLVNLVKKGALRGYLCHQKISGRDIRDGHSHLVIEIDDSHQVIVLRLIERLRAGDRSGRYHPDDLTLHKSFRQLRIFHLLRDCDLISLLDQSAQIRIHCMIRNSAHRCPLFKSTFLSRQSDLELP